MYLPPLGSIGVALWAGAPNNPRGGFFGGGILRRILAFFVSFCLVFVFVCSSFVSFAVAPVALVEAALVSYVASTGYKLWVDNGTGSDVLSLMSDLYSDWLFSLSGGTLTLEQIGIQNLVYYDNSGHICITKTAADIFQDFADWLQSNYSIVSGGSSVTVIPPDQSVTFPSFQTSGTITVSSLASPSATWDYLSSHLVRPIDFSQYETVINDFLSQHSTDLVQIQAHRDMGRVTGEVLIFAAISGVSSYNSGSNLNRNASVLSFVGSGYANQEITLSSYSTSSRLFTFYYGYGDLGWAYTCIVNANASVSSASAGLAISLAQNVIDKATDLAQDYVLVFDVGASAGATATDIVDAVVAGYDATTGAIPVTDTVTAADVIDTPVQPYPDVDSLGLPQLGLALTTRFPFSIPWDISAIYSAISAPSEPPVKTFDLIPASVLARWGINANTSITIDLTDQKYDVLLAIIHWSCIIGFCFGLAVMTKRYVWTTGG